MGTVYGALRHDPPARFDSKAFFLPPCELEAKWQLYAWDRENFNERSPHASCLLVCDYCVYSCSLCFRFLVSILCLHGLTSVRVATSRPDKYTLQLAVDSPNGHFFRKPLLPVQNSNLGQLDVLQWISFCNAWNLIQQWHMQREINGKNTLTKLPSKTNSVTLSNRHGWWVGSRCRIRSFE